MKTTLIYFVLMTGLLIHGSIYSQTVSGTVDYSMFYDDNPLRQTDGSEEYINSIQTRLDFKPFNREFYLFYSGGYDAFKNISSRNYQNHYFGLNYAFATADSSEENVFMGLNYNLKKGTSDYAIYDFNQVTAFLNGSFYLSDDMVMQGGYKLSMKQFPDPFDLTYVENLGTINLSKFFETKTGVFLQAAIGNKSYSITDVVETTMGFGMKGKGKGGFHTTSNETNIIQLRTSLKVSQSIFENTGVSFYYLSRFNLNSNKQNFQSAELIYSDDSDLWDDPYGFESNEMGFELTRILPLNITAKFSMDYSNRHYLNNAADSLNLTQRIDNKSEIWGGISRTFNSVFFLESIEAGIEYMYIINKSNTELFDYRNNLFQFSLSLSF